MGQITEERRNCDQDQDSRFRILECDLAKGEWMTILEKSRRDDDQIGSREKCAWGRSQRKGGSLI